jgi:hypothetical protein
MAEAERKYEWQEVDKVYVDNFENKSPSQISAIFAELAIKHGEDCRIQLKSYSSGGGFSMRTDSSYEGTTHVYLTVMKWLPAFDREEMLKSFAKRFEASELVRKADDEDRMAQAIKRLRDISGLNGKN